MKLATRVTRFPNFELFVLSHSPSHALTPSLSHTFSLPFTLFFASRNNSSFYYPLHCSDGVQWNLRCPLLLFVAHTKKKNETKFPYRFGLCVVIYIFPSMWYVCVCVSKFPQSIHNIVNLHTLFGILFRVFSRAGNKIIFTPYCIWNPSEWDREMDLERGQWDQCEHNQTPAHTPNSVFLLFILSSRLGFSLRWFCRFAENFGEFFCVFFRKFSFWETHMDGTRTHLHTKTLTTTITGSSSELWYTRARRVWYSRWFS